MTDRIALPFDVWRRGVVQMTDRIALPFEVWRIDYELCVNAFRIGRISEAGFRHHLTRIGYAAHEIDAEVKHHRTGGEAA